MKQKQNKYGRTLKMTITASKNQKSEYTLFLENEINVNRKIPFYESDSIDEMIEKWVKEPLPNREQQKVWDYYPKSTLAEVIDLLHHFDKRFKIETIEEMYIKCAVPQTVYRRNEKGYLQNVGRIYQYTTEERMYLYQRTAFELEIENRKLKKLLEEKNMEREK